MVQSFRWHGVVFVALNVALSFANSFIGARWWAFWPLIVTGFLLGLHYLFYKSTSVD